MRPARCGHRPARKLSIGVGTIIIAAPLFIAQEKGLFFAEGLDVVLHKYPTGKLALDGLLAGEIDVATVAETPVMFNSQEYLLA
ncbi:MAG: ABC transporter substrate-binding protein [Candidatus Methylomirabilia bacterium]